MSMGNLDLKEKLQRAVRSEEVPPYLEARIRANLAAIPRPASLWSPRWAVAGLLAAGLMGVTIAYQLGHLLLTTAAQESYVVKLTNQVASIMRVGLGDHLHCAYFGKLPRSAPRVEELVSQMGPRYSGLLPIVRQEVPEQFQIVGGHRCRYHKRPFIHIVLKGDAKLLSLVVAEKKPGEAFDVEGMLPALVQSGQPIYQTSAQRFQIASFETPEHLVYFISDLTAEQNMHQLLAMTPAVKAFLGKLPL